MLALLLSAIAAVTSMSPDWSTAKVLGWTADGSTIAWETMIASEEEDGAVGPVGHLEFLVVTDAHARILRTFRAYRTPSDKGNWTVARSAEALWQSAEPEDAGNRWLKVHELSGVPDEQPLRHKSVEDKGGKEPLTLRATLSGKDCPTILLLASLGRISGTAAEDRCAKGDPAFTDLGTWGSRVRVSWSPDGTRAAVSWDVGRHTAAHEGEPGFDTARGHLVVVSRRTLATVDLLDAGAGTSLDPLAGKLETAGFRLGHRGKAGTPRKATEIYFAPGFEPEAREAAKLVGAAPEAVQPLTWKSPYAITVAAGAGK